MFEIKVILFFVLLATCHGKPALEPDEINPNSEAQPGSSQAQAVNNTRRKEDNIKTSVPYPKAANKEYLRAYAHKMLSYMNRTVEPCDDFYEYACGNWKHVMPERQDYHSRPRNNLRDIEYTLGDMTEQLLLNSTLANNLGYSNELQIAQQFYNACLKAELYPFPAADPAYLSLIKSIGGFPAVEGDAWVATNFSWFNMSSHLSNYGAVGLINDKIYPKYPFAPYFKMPELGFDYIVSEDNIATDDTIIYKLSEKRMQEYLKAYGLPDSQVAEVIAGVFAFWRDAVAIRDDLYPLCMALPELASREELNSYYDIAWGGLNFSDIEGPQYNYCQLYYEELDKVSAKQPAAVANYLAMKLLHHMDAKLKSPKFQRDFCKHNIGISLPYLMDKLYMETFFKDETHSDINKIIVELRKSLRDLLENATWLDSSTRAEALYKESKIKPYVGPIKDEKLLENLIRAMNNLTFVPETWVQSNINLKKFQQYLKRYNGFHHKELSSDTRPLELLPSTQVRAAYFILENSINVMAGTLHPPVYHQAWPNSLKFGTLGYAVGHELTHAFDTKSSNFDGNNTRRNWWNYQSRRTYNRRADCYIDHFDNYHIPEINRTINGDETLNENIADSGGLREAMMAYRSYMKQLLKDNAENHSQVLNDEHMPGMDLSPEQLFFVGFAQVWCSSYQEEHFWAELTEKHTILKYRVLGAVSNNEEFAQSFNCPQGSRMNRAAEKCRIW